MEQSEALMQEIQQLTNDYISLSEICSKVFFALSRFKAVHYLYEFSLPFFMSIFNELLEKNP